MNDETKKQIAECFKHAAEGKSAVIEFDSMKIAKQVKAKISKRPGIRISAQRGKLETDSPVACYLVFEPARMQIAGKPKTKTEKNRERRRAKK